MKNSQKLKQSKELKLSFEPNLQYQQDAISAVIDLFDGQPLDQESCQFILQANDNSNVEHINAVCNKLLITNEQIMQNLQTIQTQNNILNNEQHQQLSFAIEMETGTGKTYVYLRTIYELNKQYGFLKFVIVVPSIAIKEGVRKNLEITKDHFQNIYDKVQFNHITYDSSKISTLREFATNNNIEVLVMNIDAFAKDENVINNSNDKLSGLQPIKFIQAVNPIVILDEPQNMETTKRQEALQKLNPLFLLRYSATHKNKSNLLYSLNPIQAYKQGLVKQIAVNSVREVESFNQAFIKVEKITATKSKKTAKIIIHSNEKSEVKEKTITVTSDDFKLDQHCTTSNSDLYVLSNYKASYKNGYVIENINYQAQCIELSNGDRIHVGTAVGALSDDIFKFQIRTTIQEHLSRELRFKEHNLNIKVLSLFFIDKVANYRQYNADMKTNIMGKFALWFEEIYQEEITKPRYKILKDYLSQFAVQEVHNGYFSQDKKGNLKDTKGDTKDDTNTYDLIMKDKERLLNINEPLRFIFSHSALREGWDNPNVFQICTLNETKSEMKKRQEIGRGLRLCVDDQGNRIYDNSINMLTIIANESYDDFAQQLQNEIEQDYGIKPEKVPNARARVTIKYRKQFELDPQFLEIWNKIKHKTRYKISYETDELIRQCVKKIKELPSIQASKLAFSKSRLHYDENNAITAEFLDTKAIAITHHIWRIPDVLTYIQKQTELTRDTIYKILFNSDRFNEIIINPQLFLDTIAKTIKVVLSEITISGIKYEKINGEEYAMLLSDSQELESYLDRCFKVKNSTKTIHENYIALDSSLEHKFAQDCESSERVKFYFKLPSSFKIPTPVGTYNPDWAIILENDKRVYFVVETKQTGNHDASLDISKLYLSEQQKIKCGEQHFKELDDVNFKVASSLQSICEQ
jgi:type III restriction enzyme